jgi:hypothetical protein
MSNNFIRHTLNSDHSVVEAMPKKSCHYDVNMNNKHGIN